mmetsp:Transcript_40956/g.123555  ORF Transcript_40956/g.123555 Transcript_40956/m.123555 type:complete len:212 (-) Transcript_40956:459-1094(-)
MDPPGSRRSSPETVRAEPGREGITGQRRGRGDGEGIDGRGRRGRRRGGRRCRRRRSRGRGRVGGHSGEEEGGGNDDGRGCHRGGREDRSPQGGHCVPPRRLEDGRVLGRRGRRWRRRGGGQGSFGRADHGRGFGDARRLQRCGGRRRRKKGRGRPRRGQGCRCREWARPGRFGLGLGRRSRRRPRHARIRPHLGRGIVRHEIGRGRHYGRL